MKFYNLSNVFLLPFYVICAYLFLYLPICLLVFFSFNNNSIGYTWEGFTIKWYRELFNSVEVWDALQNSLIVALTSVFLSIGLGTTLVYFLVRTRYERLLVTFYANLAVPEIVLTVGLLTFFYTLSVSLGFLTLIVGHTVLGLGYVVPIIYVQFAELDHRIIEASLDLGATNLQTLRYIVIPVLMPALMSAGLLVLIISFDEFVLSFFCAGPSSQTLPLYIFSAIRSGASPEVSALSVLLLGVSALAVLIFTGLQARRLRRLQ